MQIDLKASPVFLRNWNASKRIVINRGGTSSTKTYSLLQLLLNWLITGQIDATGKYFDSGTASIVRKYSASLRTSALRDFENILASSGLY